MTTARDIILIALKEAGVLGVGQTAMAEDTTDAMRLLNNMLAVWQKKRWLVPSLKDVAFTATGAQSYTVGTGGNFNTQRPDKIQYAYARQTIPSQPNLVDYPLSQIFSRENYSQISLKTLNSFPSYFFYDANWPMGNLFVWPIPSSNYEIHIVIKNILQTFTNLTDVLILPPEYEEAIHYNLAVRLRPMYQLPPDPTIIRLAKDALNVIRNANAQVPSLDVSVPFGRGSNYNVYSDSGNQ